MPDTAAEELNPATITGLRSRTARPFNGY